MNKKEHRKILQEKWDSLNSDDLAHINSATEKTISGSKEWAQCDTVLAYLDFSGEISLDALILKSLNADKKVFVPRIKRGGIMTFHELRDLNPSSLEMNYWKIREPLEDAELFKPETAGRVLLLTPGLGFTSNGKRMGRGGGYYDRFLAENEKSFDCITMGITWKGIIVPDLPFDSHDRKIRKLCCETEIIDCQPLN